MRTTVIIVAGLALLGIFVFVGWKVSAGPGVVAAAQIFLPVWLAAALLNLWIGVARAGYSVGEELPIFLAIFAVPAAVAAWGSWKMS